jgi:hypothetical protein
MPARAECQCPGMMIRSSGAAAAPGPGRQEAARHARCQWQSLAAPGPEPSVIVMTVRGPTLRGTCIEVNPWTMWNGSFCMFLKFKTRIDLKFSNKKTGAPIWLILSNITGAYRTVSMSSLSIFDEVNGISLPDKMTNEPWIKNFEASCITPEVGRRACSIGQEIYAANNILIKEYCR